MSSDVRARGDWPGAVQLRRGWAAARARPWNDQSDSAAALRLDRGSDRFLVACSEWLHHRGAARILTPALATGQTALWRRAGFVDHLELTVLERSLGIGTAAATRQITKLADPDMAALAVIDDRAFNETWRVGWRGLVDALGATTNAETLAVEASGTVVGFAIVGESLGVSYLQRLAVDPDATGQGIGRSLVRAAIGWARARGARTMLLNTQPENTVATRLYLSEGFTPLEARLRVLLRTGEVADPP